MDELAHTTNDRREIFGWAMYDWANSAFSTTVGTVFLAPYINSLTAQAAVLSGNGRVGLGFFTIDPYSFFPLCVFVSVILQVFILPVTAAIADYSHLRKRMLQLFATLGALQTIMLFLVTESLWWLGGLLFIGANLSFGAAVVLYNAYLPDIASEDQRDRVSSFGWAMGYLGGGILLALNLAFYGFHEALGVPTSLAVRINLASAGVWWLGFSFMTWAGLRHRRARRALPPGQTLVGMGFRQLGRTFAEIRCFPETLKFLGAYFLYNDGIQTIIIIAAAFATAPLVHGGLELEQETLTLVILMIQIVAFIGALLWGRLAGRVGAKRSIMVSLLVWAGVVIYAYFGLRGANRGVEFAALGAVIAVVLGGSQAISRSLFAQMIPTGKEAEFFSFYEISDRGTSAIGPFLFALMNEAFGSYRPAILGLILFFIAGIVALSFLDERRAIQSVRESESSSN